MLSDLRFALRQIAKFPGYTAVVVLTLALGIGVNTQIFSMVSSMFLQPLAVRDAERLTVVVEHSAAFSMPHGVSFLDFQDLRDGSKTLTDAIVYFSTPTHVGIPGKTPERAWVEAVSPDAFAKLGVTVALGRPLHASDGALPPGTPAAVLTHRYWQSHFAGDPAVIGRPVLINGQPFTIVGIAKPGFDSFSWALTVSMFVPSGTLPLLRTDGGTFFQSRFGKIWTVLAYRAPGATAAEVSAELAVFARRFAQDFPEDHRHSRLQAMPERRARPAPAVAEYMPAMIALFMGLVTLVLLISCANVANLIGARALAREKELVVRAALGATRGRLVRQLLLESLLLAILAGAAGYLLAVWGGDTLQNFIPTGDAPIRREPPQGWQLFVFTAGISLLAGVLSGLFPALRASRVDLSENLKQGAGRSTSDGRHRLRNLLVIGQVAVSCVVLISTVLFLRGLHAAGSLNLGFRPDRLVMLSLDLSLQGYDQASGRRFQEEALTRVRALPGVESAAFSQHVPFNYNVQMRRVWPEHPAAPVPDGHTSIAFTAVTPGFLTTLGVPLLRGRDLTAADQENSPLVAVINEAMADAFWPGRDPLGQHFRFDRLATPLVKVVGVTATGKYVMLTESPSPYFYVPSAQHYGMPTSLLVRAAAPASGESDPAGTTQTLAHSLTDTIHALDANLPVYNVVTLDEHLASSVFALMPLRTGAMLAAVQGVIALFLAILGLYAVVAFNVTGRTREIGVRIALGATDDDVLRLVSREGLRLTVIGVLVGLVLASGVAFGLSRVLFGVRTFDPVAYPLVALVLLGTAALACWIPARRATKVDPMTALRAE